MDRNKLQIEACKAMFDPRNSVAYAELDDESIALSTNGVSCYVLSKKEVVFDLSKIRSLPILKEQFNEKDKDEKITNTGKLFMYHGELLAKYAGDSVVAYVNSKLIKPFYGCEFFTNSACSRIVVKDMLGRLVGLVMPVRYEEKEQTK